MSVGIHPLVDVDPAALRQFLGELPWSAWDWDETLQPADRVALARAVLRPADEPDHALAVTDGERIVGVGRLRALAWDERWFGLPMGEVCGLRVGRPDAIQPLLEALGASARRAGLAHLRVRLDARDLESIGAAQDLGWRMRWAAVRMVRDTTDVVSSSGPLHQDGAVVRDARRDDLPALLGIASRLERYNWLEHEAALPAEQRRTYVARRLRGLFDEEHADRILVLETQGRVVGMHATKCSRHERLSGPPTPVGLVRDVFVDPDVRGRGYSILLKQAALARVAREVRYVSGSVRLGAVRMLRAIERKRLFRTWGGEHLLTLSALDAR